MPTSPTPITALPTPPSRTDPANFPARADAFVAQMPTFGTQANTLAANVFGNATEAATSATAAAASQVAAAASQTAAAASALTAVNAPGTSGTSTTSLTIGTGSQTFTTQTGKAWVVGQFVTVASTASPTNSMHGQITAYNSGTGSMTVNVLSVGGSGTLASWTIGLVGPNATLTDQASLQPVTLTLPSIRPSLLLDFANAKKLDPRITFTRATSATYYDGVTSAKAEENLLLRSQDFSTTWTLANLTAGSAVTAPDATGTGSSFTASAANGTLTQSVTAVAGDHTFSVWLRRVSGTGNIDITAHSGGTWVTQTITSSWARYTVTQTLTAGARTPGIRIVTSGDQIEVWGAQLEQRSAATAYTPTTTQPITNYVPQLLTAPAGVPRFDHNPTTGESLGLLVEEQRTNLLTYSEQFDNAIWSNTRSSDAANVAIAPDGTLTADKLIANTDNATHFVSQSLALSAITYTFSVYAKAAEYSGLRLFWTEGTNPSASFDLLSGAVTSVGTGVTASIVAVGNGWYRCTYTKTNASAANNPQINVGSDGTTFSFIGNNTSGIFIWGAQLEAGAFATSYIPTTTASVTRSADAASMTEANFSSWYRADEGTLYCELGSLASTASTQVPGFNVGDSNNRIEMRVVGNSIGHARGVVQVGGAGQADISITTLASTAARKVSMSYKVNDFYITGNGSASGSSDTSGTVPVVSQAQIGTAPYDANLKTNGHIRKIAYYPKRLTNAELQALTA